MHRDKALESLEKIKTKSMSEPKPCVTFHARADSVDSVDSVQGAKPRV